jgi:hypothetical protein
VIEVARHFSSRHNLALNRSQADSDHGLTTFPQNNCGGVSYPDTVRHGGSRHIREDPQIANSPRPTSTGSGQALYARGP